MTATLPTAPAQPAHRVPQGLALCRPEVAAAHKEQLEQVAQAFRASGWTLTEQGTDYRSSRTNNAHLGWARFIDTVTELRVNYVYEMGRSNTLACRLAVLAKPARQPASNTDEDLRIVHMDSVDVAYLDEVVTWAELDDAQRAEHAFSELAHQGLLDPQRMLPQARLARALESLDP